MDQVEQNHRCFSGVGDEPPGVRSALADEALAAQVQCGSLRAFEELVLRFEKRVYGFVLQLCANPVIARDITQDTFIKAFHRINSFNTKRSFTAWVFAIARNQSADYFRAASTIPDELSPDIPDPRDSPDEVVGASEERSSLWALARQTLPPLQFQALWLCYADDMNVAEIAVALQKTKTYVKVLLFRARRSLLLAKQVHRDPRPASAQSCTRTSDGSNQGRMETLKTKTSLNNA